MAAGVVPGVAGDRAGRRGLRPLTAADLAPSWPIWPRPGPTPSQPTGPRPPRLRGGHAPSQAPPGPPPNLGRAPVPIPGRRSVVAIMSGTSVRGRWEVAPELAAFVLWGGVKIDLRQAIIRSPVVDIRATTLRAASTSSPEGILVEVYGTVLMGSCSNRQAGRARCLRRAGRPGARGRALGAKADVRSKPNPSAGAEPDDEDLDRHDRHERNFERHMDRLDRHMERLDRPIATPGHQVHPGHPAPERGNRPHSRVPTTPGSEATPAPVRRRRACRSTSPRARSRCCSPTSSTPPPPPSARRPALGGCARAPRPDRAGGGRRPPRHGREGQRRRLPDRVPERPQAVLAAIAIQRATRSLDAAGPEGPVALRPGCTPARWSSATATSSGATSSRPPHRGRRPRRAGARVGVDQGARRVLGRPRLLRRGRGQPAGSRTAVDRPRGPSGRSGLSRVSCSSGR